MSRGYPTTARILQFTCSPAEKSTQPSKSTSTSINFIKTAQRPMRKNSPTIQLSTLSIESTGMALCDEDCLILLLNSMLLKHLRLYQIYKCRCFFCARCKNQIFFQIFLKTHVFCKEFVRGGMLLCNHRRGKQTTNNKTTKNERRINMITFCWVTLCVGTTAMFVGGILSKLFG